VKVALICPPKLLPYFGKFTSYDMIIPEQLTDPAASFFYANKPSFKILDNGAAEGEPIPADRLLELAKTTGVDEVIAPDVIGDADASIQLAAQFVSAYTNKLAEDTGFARVRVMGVVHGNGSEEVMKCAEAYYDMGFDTFGVPRYHVAIQRDARLHITPLLRERWPTMDIHWLGCNPLFPDEVRLASVAYREVIRGVDSATPFYYAAANSRLHPDVHITRDPDLNTRDWTEEEIDLAALNIARLVDWANTETPVSVVS
jgi:hypothetical protein